MFLPAVRQSERIFSILSAVVTVDILMKRESSLKTLNLALSTSDRNSYSSQSQFMFAYLEVARLY